MKKVIIIFFMLSLSIYSFAYAQIRPNKSEVRLQINPGEKITDSIIVENISDKEILVKAYFEDLLYPAPFTGIKDTKPLGTIPYSCGKWVTVIPQEVLIPVKGKQELSYTINVPKDAKGGYYGVLYLEKAKDAVDAGVSVGLIIRVGCSFFLETKDKINAAKLEDIVIDSTSFNGNLSNTGNALLVSQGTYYVLDEKGVVVDRGNIEKYFLFPKGKATFTAKFAKPIPQGNATLVISFELGEGKALLKEIDFSKDVSGMVKIIKQRD